MQRNIESSAVSRGTSRPWKAATRRSRWRRCRASPTGLNGGVLKSDLCSYQHGRVGVLVLTKVNMRHVCTLSVQGFREKHLARGRQPPGGKLGRGTTRAEDAQGTPTHSRISPVILVYNDERGTFRQWKTATRRTHLRRYRASPTAEVLSGSVCNFHQYLNPTQ